MKEDTLVRLVFDLSEQCILFNSLFIQFRAIIFNDQNQVLQETKLGYKLNKEAKQILIDLKSCQERITRDINVLEKVLNEKSHLLKNQFFYMQCNLNDCFDTCETVFKQYDNFFRKDIKLLKETFAELIISIKDLNNLIIQYNNTTTDNFILPQINNSHEKLYAVINLGYDIISLPQIDLQVFQQQYPVANKSFVEYLKFLKDSLQPREIYKWLILLEQYFDFCQKDGFENMLYNF